MAVWLGSDNIGNFVSSDGYTLQDSNSMPLMALPLSSKKKIILGNITYRVNIILPAKESE